MKISFSSIIYNNYIRSINFFLILSKRGVRVAISQNWALEILKYARQIEAFSIPDHLALTVFMEVVLTLYRAVPV